MILLPHHKLTRYDVLVLILIALLIPLSGILLFRHSGSVCVVTCPAGEVRYSLSENRTFTVEGDGELCLIITIADGAVSVTSSDCPDGICVRTGSISRTGESIVCVPAKTVIAIEGASTDKGVDRADFIIG